MNVGVDACKNVAGAGEVVKFRAIVDCSRRVCLIAEGGALLMVENAGLRDVTEIAGLREAAEIAGLREYCEVCVELLSSSQARCQPWAVRDAGLRGKVKINKYE